MVRKEGCGGAANASLTAEEYFQTDLLPPSLECNLN